ncbi:Uncharacterized protein TCM_018741 [Theobroma cacao]|uniref:Reverse transcriptase domain-containing protein n=1 Tax=Theobroma cacao TaxID=3641 RepID=A0A061EFG4_THECC|nr:Uncharacterized protein TCM_018741 [Theobroma cacao]
MLQRMMTRLRGKGAEGTTRGLISLWSNNFFEPSTIKVIAIKLKGVIGLVIGSNLFAFVRRKQILDYSLIVNEVIDSLKKSMKSGFPFKVDFEKAFNSVDWDYLDFVMKLMGFRAALLVLVLIRILLNSVPIRLAVLHDKLVVKAVLMNRGIISRDKAMCNFLTLSLSLPLGCYNRTLLKKDIAGKCFSLPLFGLFGFVKAKSSLLSRPEIPIELIIDIILLRHSLWCKGKWNLRHISTNTCFIQPSAFINSGNKPKFKKKATWTPPPLDSLTLNAGGLTRGKPGLAGIEGVLRDHNNYIRGTFFHHIGIEDSNFVEFQAIHQGIVFFLASPYWKLRVSPLMSFFGPQANSVADGLAKAGVIKVTNHVEVFKIFLEEIEH